MEYLLGSILAIIVYGALSVIVLALLRLFVVPSPSYPLVPFVIGLSLSWILSWPVCTSIITKSQLKTLSWGHTGEAFWIPFLALTPFVFVVMLSRLRRKNTPNHTVGSDARSSSARGAP